MSKVTITFEDDTNRKMVNVSIESDPDLGLEKKDCTPAQRMALMALHLIQYLDDRANKKDTQ